MALERCFNQSLQIGAAGDVGRHGQSAQRVGDRLQWPAAPRGQHQHGALGRQQARGREPHAGRGTGDNRDLAGQAVWRGCR